MQVSRGSGLGVLQLLNASKPYRKLYTLLNLLGFMGQQVQMYDGLVLSIIRGIYDASSLLRAMSLLESSAEFRES